jgi:hypothetical protein
LQQSLPPPWQQDFPLIPWQQELQQPVFGWVVWAKAVAARTIVSESNASVRFIEILLLTF